jgi:predicted alpha/beta hydrolase family esterase
MKRVFIIHGYWSTPNSHWLPWLAKELKNRGFEVFSPQMPGDKNPLLEDWMAVISKMQGNAQKEDIFVGHSLGCITILKRIASLRDGEKIKGAVLVGGFIESIGRSAISNFTEDKLDISSLHKHADKFISIVSSNDYAVPKELSLKMNDEIRGKAVILENKGHFKDSDGVNELPEVLSAVLEISELS